MEVFYDKVKKLWRAELSWEVTTWGESEEDARIEMMRCLNRILEETKLENREANDAHRIRKTC